MSDSIWTRPLGSSPSWRSTRVTDLTGDELAAAVRQGVLRAMGWMLFLSVIFAWLFRNL